MSVLIISINLSGTFPIRKSIEIVNLNRYTCKGPVIFPIVIEFKFTQQIFVKKSQISIFMKIRPVGAKLLHADGHRDGPTD